MSARLTLVRDYLQRALAVLPLNDPDLAELEALLERGVALTRMPELKAGEANGNVIELREAARRLRPA